MGDCRDVPPAGRRNDVQPSVTTLGFEPSCGCDADPVPGVVLDPFAGAGTTGLVAVRHKREFVGVELNEEYAQMSRDRIQRYLDLGFREARSPSAPEDQEALF